MRTFMVLLSSVAWMLTSSADPMAPPAGWCIMMRVLGMAQRLPFVPAACVHRAYMSCVAGARSRRSVTCHSCITSTAALTSSSVAVLSDCPKAIVLISGFIVFNVSRIAITEYGLPPAGGQYEQAKLNVCHPHQQSSMAHDSRSPGELMYSLMSDLSSNASSASRLATTCVAICQPDNAEGQAAIDGQDGCHSVKLGLQAACCVDAYIVADPRADEDDAVS